MILLLSAFGPRIAHKGNIAPIFRCKGNPYKERIDMDAVENDAPCETLVGKGHANNTRFPGAHGGHSIEQMCNSAKPVVDSSYQSVRSRLAVTDRHPNSARSEALHKSRRHAFWCQSHHGRSDCG